MKKVVEILAPAGSFQSLQASFKAGADAVYMGGRRFGARAYCDNPEEEDLIRAINYAHLRGKRLYLTVNTVIKEQELDELVDFLAPLYEAGLDAVIVQDLGLVSIVQGHFPELPIHLSTQMSVTEGSAVKLLGEGVTRVVPARELTIKELQRLKESTGVELEVFVHGALCYSYSGQCLFSSMCGDRSGNRGRCAQPCRKKYTFDGKKSYILSPKDICTLERLPELIEAGVDSFKIEGRMKSPEYAAGVANIYRRACDLYFKLGRDGYYEYIASHREQWDEYNRNLLDLFNRGGFSKGYAFTEPGEEMMSVKRPNHEGVLVGRALIKGGMASLKPEVKLYKGDVLEIRNNSSAEWYSYTMPENTEAFSKSKKYIKFKAYSKLYSSRMEGTEVDVFRYRAQGLLDRLDEEFVNSRDKILVKGELKAEVGEPMELTLSLVDENLLTGERHEIKVAGDVVSEAATRPVSEEFVRDKILRSGESDFSFSELTVKLGDNAFIPKSQLGNLRRSAIEALENAIVGSFARSKAVIENESRATDDSKLGLEASGSVDTNSQVKELQVLPTSKEQLEVLLAEEAADGIIFDQQFETFESLFEAEMLKELVNCGKKLYLRTLHVYDDRNAPLQKRLLELADGKLNIAGIYVRNLSIMSKLLELGAVKEGRIKLIADYNLYAANEEAVNKLYELGAAGFTYSPELSKRECLAIKSPENMLSCMDIYARVELMLSRQCLKKTIGKCNHKREWLDFSDENGNIYKLYTNCPECKNVIYDSEPTCLFGLTKELSLDVGRIILTDETKSELKSIISAYIDSTELNKQKIRCKLGHFQSTVL